MGRHGASSTLRTFGAEALAKAAPHSARLRGLLIDRNPSRLLETAQRLGLHDRITDHLRRHAGCGPHDAVSGRPLTAEADASRQAGDLDRYPSTGILRRSVLENRGCPHCDHRHIIYLDGQDLTRVMKEAKV